MKKLSSRDVQEDELRPDYDLSTLKPAALSKYPRLALTRLPKMRPVKSSSIQSVGYDRTAHTLFVRLAIGWTHVYQHVEPEVFDDFMSSRAKDRFFDENIRARSEGQPAV